jgi:multiple sugar transport system substrate-binding protein
MVLLAFSLVLSACQPSPVGVTPGPGRTQSPSPTPAAIQATRPAPTLPAPTLTPTPTPLPKSPLGIEASELNGIPLRFWRARVDHFHAAGVRDVFQELIDEFNRDNPWGITVESTLYDDHGQIIEALQTSLYGERPDLISAYSYQAARLDSFGETLADADAYVFDPEWGLAPDEVEDFYPPFWNQDRAGQKRLGVPLYRSAQVLFYNQTWAEELGFDAPPSSAEEFEEQVCAAAQANRLNEVEGGGWAINTDAPTILGWIYAFDGQVTRPDGGYAFRSEQAQQAFAFLHKLYTERCAWIVGTRYPNAEFASRQALVITGSLTGLPFQADAMAEAGSTDRWKVIPFLGQGEPAIVAYGPSLSILESTPLRELASWLFIEWLVSPENQSRWVEAYGVFPTRQKATVYLDEYMEGHPQWVEALGLVEAARGEPAFASWRSVRWAVSDAGSFLFSPFFSVERLPVLLEELDQTARDLHEQLR